MNGYPLEAERHALRIPNEVKALLSALQLSNPDMSPLENLSDEEWTSLLAFSNIAHLTLPMAQLCMKGFPDWVIEGFRTNVADNALRFERVKATYREAAGALERAGVEHVVIKGFTQSPDYVADPRLRYQSDIDFFCPQESIDAAHSALLSVGYESSRSPHSPVSDHEPTLVRLGDWRWRGNSFDPEMPLGIELHFCLWNESISHIRVPEARLFWERRTIRQVAGFSYSCLSPLDHLAHFTLHIVRNLFLGDWTVHHVRELALFLHTHADDDKFWVAWSKTHSPLLRSFGGIAFYYASIWFDCRLHPLVAHEIERIPAARQSWLRRFSGSGLVVMFEQNKDALWLQLSFPASPMEKCKMLKGTLIPRRIGSVDAPAVRMRNKRLINSRGMPLWLQYIRYLICRTAAHGRANLATLGRGLRWRLAEVLKP